MTLYEELRSVLEALDLAKVDYALIGALAVAVWGVPRATKDIDLLVRREDLPRAMDAVRGRGYALEALPMRFKDGSEMQRINKVDEGGRLVTLDFMLVEPAFEAVWSSRTRLPFEDGEVTVVSRDALIAMKALAARPQDLVDIQNLQDIDR